VVELNVGGIPYITRLETLRRYPQSMLGAMFSRRHKIEQSKRWRYYSVIPDVTWSTWRVFLEKQRMLTLPLALHLVHTPSFWWNPSCSFYL